MHVNRKLDIQAVVALPAHYFCLQVLHKHIEPDLPEEQSCRPERDMRVGQ